MTATINITSKFLNMDDLKLLARHSGPCVTVSIPGYQPGAAGGSRHAHLRHLAQTAADRSNRGRRDGDAVPARVPDAWRVQARSQTRH